MLESNSSFSFFHFPSRWSSWCLGHSLPTKSSDPFNKSFWWSRQLHQGKPKLFDRQLKGRTWKFFYSKSEQGDEYEYCIFLHLVYTLGFTSYVMWQYTQNYPAFSLVQTLLTNLFKSKLVIYFWSLQVHDQGCLMAVGCNNGNTSLLELSDSLSVSNK